MPVILWERIRITVEGNTLSWIHTADSDWCFIPSWMFSLFNNLHKHLTSPIILHAFLYRWVFLDFYWINPVCRSGGYYDIPNDSPPILNGGRIKAFDYDHSVLRLALCRPFLGYILWLCAMIPCQHHIHCWHHEQRK